MTCLLFPFLEHWSNLNSCFYQKNRYRGTFGLRDKIYNQLDSKKGNLCYLTFEINSLK